MWDMLAVTYCEYMQDKTNEYKHGRFQGALAMYRVTSKASPDFIKTNLNLYWRKQCVDSVLSQPSVVSA
jgi:hypothetical protein